MASSSSAKTTVQSKMDFGAGLTTQKPAVSGQKDETQTSRVLAMGSYFLSGCMAINASQALGAPLSLINEDWYNAWIAFTKQSWGLLMMTMTQCWAPTVIRVSGHESVRGQLHKTTDGNLLCTFPERLVLIANHQIYTDWLYLWWMGYTAGMHGHVYIVLKESLKKIPILGWGMQFSQFIFLKRNWEMDKPRLTKHLQKLKKPSDPMWLMLFPEGTNLADCTRGKSKRWAEKHKIDDMQHQLLPRSTGLQFCLEELHKTIDYVYDCTIAYEGVPRGQYAQDIFTLGGSYLGGNPPKSVNMYWRRFPVSSIPLHDSHKFEYWLRARWTEKDRLIEHYYRTGRFPADTDVSQGSDGKTRRGAGYIETEIKPTHWYEFLQIFAPIGLFALVLYVFYGALPKRVLKTFDKKLVVDEASKNEQAKLPEKPQLFDAVLKAFGDEMFGLKNAATTQKLAMSSGLLQQAVQTAQVTSKPHLVTSSTQKQAAKNQKLIKVTTEQKALTNEINKQVKSSAKKKKQQKPAVASEKQQKPAVASEKPKPKNLPATVPVKLQKKQVSFAIPEKLETNSRPPAATKKIETRPPTSAAHSVSQAAKKRVAKHGLTQTPQNLVAKSKTPPTLKPAPKQTAAKPVAGSGSKKVAKNEEANADNRSLPKKLEIRSNGNGLSKQKGNKV